MSFPSRTARIYSRLEHRADAAIHAFGAGFAVLASLWLLGRVSGPAVIAGVSVYCAGLLGMIFASAAYNLAPTGRLKEILRRFDHAAIFIMIAATYTPFALNRMGYPVGDIILAGIWAAAAIGIVLKLSFPHRFERLSIVFYLGMGWLIVTAIRPLAASLAAVDLWLLVAGGVVYTAGVAFYLVDRIPYHKAIWHGFVLAAAIMHFTAISLEFVR
jgi:hemolysin III